MNEPLVSRALRISLYIIFALGLLGTLTLPMMLEYYTGYFYDSYYLEPGYRGFILTFLYCAAVPCLWVIAELIFMLRSIPKGPFRRRNARALRRIGVIFLALSVLFFVKCAFYATFLTMCCGVLFVVAGLFTFTLAELFRQAVAFKEENDLTI